MTTNNLSYTQAALALSLVKAKSPSKLYYMLRELGSAKALLYDPDVIQPLLTAQAWQELSSFCHCPNSSELGQRIAKIEHQLGQLNAQVMAYGTDCYPKLLAKAHDAPALLYVRGNPNALHLPAIAIVGARHCTAQGGENAQRFAANLAAGGFCVVSGLATGIDGCAHCGALDAGGSTVAVMATGIDQIYPVRHRQLAENILANEGALVTELPLGSKPLRPHFPQRNRIISGLSLGVLVVEAKLKSGSLITARTALGQDREVFAIPGSIHNPMAKGCHQLIKTGAKLVETSDDIITELGALLALKQKELTFEQNSTTTVEQTSNQEQIKILEALAHEAKTLDDLTAATGINVEQLMVELLHLELSGLVAQTDGRVERIFT